ncbi:hypothetical protein Slin15195_G035610 [Septoria linicola]|uniref:Uncharacterized protein n=1 Tax=Septoria linicola TaxID=215465 RepID=A0A9Q9AJ26_9PEZI|nr:hypothetical protein Slin14017_G116970 [Septoria linicola]USW50242.1 hypothetical protein Slin15195_G035610 [Septoria linicola]
MLFANIVGGAAFFAAAAVAHPLAEAAAFLSTNPNLEISKLVINDTATGKTLLSFSVKNPEPLASQSVAECRGEWDHTKKDWPVSNQALRCDKSQTITWFIDSWTSARDFVVGVQDRFDDPSVGKDPYDRVTTFSKFIVNETYVHYDSPVSEAGSTGSTAPTALTESSESISGTQIPDQMIYAPVYAVSAK